MLRSVAVRLTASALVALASTTIAHAQNVDFGLAPTRAEIVAGVRSADAEVRRDSAMRLVRLKDPAAVTLITPLLGDRVEIVRATAAGELGRLGDPVTAPALLDAACNDKKPFVRRSAAAALGEIGDRSVAGALGERLRREKKHEVRAAILTSLGALGDGSVASLIVPMLKDKKPFVRREAVRALGRLRAHAAVRDIVIRLEDEAADVRRSAAEALGLIGDRSTEQALSRAVHDPDPYVADEALRSLRIFTAKETKP